MERGIKEAVRLRWGTPAIQPKKKNPRPPFVSPGLLGHEHVAGALHPQAVVPVAVVHSRASPAGRQGQRRAGWRPAGQHSRAS